MKSFFDLQRFVKTVKLTAKADNYENETENVKILALGGNDTIDNDAAKVTIDGGAGNDSIRNFEDNISIAGGAGNDTIYDLGDDNIILGGAGNDSISPGDFATVTGGKGNDTIDAYAHYSRVIKYSSGDGNEDVGGFNSTTKSGNDFIVTVGKQKITLGYAALNEYDKVIIKDSSGKVAVYNDWKVMNGTSGKDDLENEANNVTVNGGKGNDDISNYGSYVTILGGAGNDTIWSTGKDVNISGGAGNDSIKNTGGDNSTVSGGDGKDYIGSTGSNCVVDGGKGNDSIVAYFADNSTITGGKGNDSIDIASADDAVIKYASGDGKDKVLYFGSDDTLHITKGSYSVKTSGNDVVVKVGKGSITLKDAVGTSISIKDSSGKVTTKTYASSALFAEDNFATADNLSSITKNNLTPTALEKISESNFEYLTVENNLVTFADKYNFLCITNYT